MKLHMLTVLAVALILPIAAHAQSKSDVDAINRLLDRHAELESASDMMAQAAMMSTDRVLIVTGAGRWTDQAMNMAFQQAAIDAANAIIPGVTWFTDYRDRLIRFYGNGSVAVASFYRYMFSVPPPDASIEVAEKLSPIPAMMITMVFEKRGDVWMIVHTHISALEPPATN